MVVHVSLDLHREKLRRQHQPGLAVPCAQAPIGGVGVERTARVLVEADHDADVVGAGGDQRAGDGERAATRGAGVLDVEEREPREAEDVHHRVRVAGVLATARRELDVAPREPGVLERAPYGGSALRETRHALVAPERRDAGPDDGNLSSGAAHEVCSSGRNA